MMDGRLGIVELDANKVYGNIVVFNGDIGWTLLVGGRSRRETAAEISSSWRIICLKGIEVA